jgi:hypothetical protein
VAPSLCAFILLPLTRIPQLKRSGVRRYASAALGLRFSLLVGHRLGTNLAPTGVLGMEQSGAGRDGRAALGPGTAALFRFGTPVRPAEAGGATRVRPRLYTPFVPLHIKICGGGGGDSTAHG